MTAEQSNCDQCPWNLMLQSNIDGTNEATARIRESIPDIEPAAAVTFGENLQAMAQGMAEGAHSCQGFNKNGLRRLVKATIFLDGNYAVPGVLENKCHNPYLVSEDYQMRRTQASNWMVRKPTSLEQARTRLIKAQQENESAISTKHFTVARRIVGGLVSYLKPPSMTLPGKVRQAKAELVEFVVQE